MSLRIKKAEFFRSVVDLAKLPHNNLHQIAFAGRSNVGKSTLLNTLTNQKNLAKISSTPGKTQQINFFNINNQLYFVDLPGYGFAQASKLKRKEWGELIENYLKTSDNLKGIIHLIDIRHPPFEIDLQLKEWLDFYHKKALIVLTKADKISKSQSILQLQKAKEILKTDEENIVVFSAKTRQGKERILDWISNLITEER